MGMEVAAEEEPKKKCRALIFTYGTLKRGFSNHNLIQDLVLTGDAVFRGAYTTSESFPLVCGPYRVPFLLNIPGSGHPVTGELYAVSAYGLSRMDELEGTSRGHYQRLGPIRLTRAAAEEADDEAEAEAESEAEAEAYFADRSYEMELWKKSGKLGFRWYGEKEAKGYVKRKDRPQNLSFLEHIRIFLSSSTDQ
ncbi:hypothetical protein AB3S75_037890 [Citrus x aurantiifolia]